MAICGIATTRGGRPVEARELEGMLSLLAVHPDWSPTWASSEDAGFGAVALPATASLWSSDQVLAVFEGDLYNRDELQKTLSVSRPALNPAALLASLFLDEGPACLQRLRGAYSFAIWDHRRKSLLLAVDRFGIKPLYYAKTVSELIFASQPRGLFAGGRVPKSVNRAAIVEYLNFTAVPAPHSAFEGVERLLPGSYLVWEKGQARVARYWEMQYPEDTRSTKKQLAEELLHRMEEAVRLVSAEVTPAQLGCFLSGGTDSSSITGLLTRIIGQPARTFSIGFAEPRFDELGYADVAAQHFHTEHHQSVLGPDATLETIPRIVAAYDEPFGNASVIPTLHCQILARERGARTMLAGDGGDELFGGNERYRTEQIFGFYQRIPSWLRRGLLEPMICRSPISAGIIGKLQRYIQRANLGNPERYCEWLLLQRFPPSRVLAPEMLSQNGNSDLLSIPRALYRAAKTRTELNRLLYVDAQMTLADNDLPKVVRTAELAGVTVRFPYLDHVLAEFSGRIPACLKVRRLEKRYLFKLATRRLLPKAILQKKKHGFGLPIGAWIRSNPRLRGWAEEILMDPRSYQRGYFRREFVEELFRLMDSDNTTYYGDLLWLFLMLELWHRQHIERKAA